MHTKCDAPTAEITTFDVIINGMNIFDPLINNGEGTYDNIKKIGNGQGDDYTISCLLDYAYFKEHYGMITIDLSKK